MSRKPIGRKRKQGAGRSRLRWRAEARDVSRAARVAASDREREGARAAAQDQTLYLSIKLNDTIPRKVGVFIPKQFQPTTSVDLIVYFHGHIIPDCKTNETPFLNKGMEYYWGTPFFLCLREELAASRANAVLIAPTFVAIFGSSATPSRFGNLHEDGKFDFLINQALTRLTESGALPAAARARKIILSGHSAGGLPMLRILEADNELKPNIAECWGFECLYFDTPGWSTWLSANPGKLFRHFRRPAVLEPPTTALKRFRNFVDVKNGTDHCLIVKEKWREAIDKSGALQRGDEVA
jgi:hypothetical protein